MKRADPSFVVVLLLDVALALGVLRWWLGAPWWAVVIGYFVLRALSLLERIERSLRAQRKVLESSIVLAVPPKS